MQQKNPVKREEMIKVIIDKLFDKIKEKPPTNNRMDLSLSSAEGLSFDACQRYTDDQYFVDITFLDNIQIKGLFFDGRKLEIGGFGSAGKPLTLGLVERLYKNIEKITQDYNATDLMYDINKGRLMPFNS